MYRWLDGRQRIGSSAKERKDPSKGIKPGIRAAKADALLNQPCQPQQGMDL
jgi:hypothetical protein